MRTTTKTQARGITIIDVLISVVVMGIIASLVIPSLMTATHMKKDTNHHEDHKMITESENEHHSQTKIKMKTEHAHKTVSLSSSDKDNPLPDDL